MTTGDVNNLKLKNALNLYQDKWLASFPDEDELEKISFSPAFESKMAKMIRAEKKPYWRFVNTLGKRVACIAAIIIIATTGTAFGVEAIREPLIDFIVETYEKFSTIIFGSDEPKSAIDELPPPVKQDLRLPAYIPEGFEEYSEMEGGYAFFDKDYIDSHGNMLMFQQMYNEGRLNIDTEGAVVEEITVAGKGAIYFENKGYSTILITDEVYAYFVSGMIEKEELIKIVESIPFYN